MKTKRGLRGWAQIDRDPFRKRSLVRLHPRNPRLSFAGVLTLTTIGMVGCAAPQDDPSYLRVAITSSPRDLDPRIGVDEVSQRVHQLVFTPLFKLDARLKVVPGLAASWETPDPTTYIVRLRSGVRFHDGSLLTADDVVYTFASFLEPSFVSGRKGAYRSLAAVEALDAETVRFRLKEPFGSFPIQLVMGIVKRGANNTSTQPLGTGPYRFVRAIADDHVVLERFDGYFDGPARNPGLVLKVVPDDTMRGLELRKGAIDVNVNDLSPDIVHELARSREVTVTTAPGVDYQYVGLNLRDPILSDVRVRQALAYAVDRQAIVDHLRRGLATPAVGLLPPMSWVTDRSMPDFAYDPDRARRLLDEAGYPDPDGDGPRGRFRLTLKTSTTEFTRLQATVLQQNWKRVGVEVALHSYELATFLSDVARGQFQMCMLQWVGVTDPDMLRRVFHSAQVPPAGFNRGHFKDPEVDALIERATRSTDDRERQALYSLVQRRVAEAVAYISLWHKTNAVITQPAVTGVSVSPNADFIFLRDVGRLPAPLTADSR
jgi:peptide/nickel transport system substrate-binding protein